MGINGLLPLLKNIENKKHLTEFKGKKVAIDGFVWLHKSASHHSVEFVKNPTTEVFLPYLMRKIKNFQEIGIIPIIIFDGQSLPSKFITNEKRHKERKEAFEHAIKLESLGKPVDAEVFFKRSIEITSKSVFVWIKELQKLGIEYYVSPYEADAQLAYLARIGYVDYVLTEDSDLLVYQTPNVLYKLDDYYNVIQINYQDVLNYLNLTSDQFTTMCIYAGCDYVESISQMGIKTALNCIQTYKDHEEIYKFIQTKSKFKIPEDWLNQFKKAFLTFQSQRVYDPIKNELTFVSPLNLPSSPDYLGKDIPLDLLKPLIKGTLDTKTLSSLIENQSTSISPYFINKLPKKSSSSPYFNEFTKKKEKPQYPFSKITSYFEKDLNLKK